MLKFIGHTDAELRDKLIYTTIMKWGEEKGITYSKMKYIFQRVRDAYKGRYEFVYEVGIWNVFNMQSLKPYNS